MKPVSVLVVFVVVFVLVVPAAAHTTEQQTEWETAWTADVFDAGGLTPALLAEWADFQHRHPPPPVRAASKTSVSVPAGPNVERWRPLLETYFAASDVPWALAVIRCESGGDPLADKAHSTASGLFQHLGSFWPERSAAAGWAGASIWNPDANIAVAAWLLYTGGPGHWNASRTCWG